MNQKIENVLLEHHINRLCHMTQIDKLFSILYGDMMNFNKIYY